MNTSQIRNTVNRHAGRLTRSGARSRRLQLLLAMIVGLVIGMAVVSVFTGGDGSGSEHRVPASVSGQHQFGPGHDDD